MTSAADVIADLGASDEIERLRARVQRWIDTIDPEMHDPVAWAFQGTPKYFRPLTMFGCHRALHQTPVDDAVIESAFVVELMHNMSLVIDDVLDRSDERRGVATVHAKFGSLPALMASGYLVADAFDTMRDDPFAVQYLAELLRRLGGPSACSGGCVASRLGVADWRRIAGEDTGSMFEICAVLGARSERLRQYGHLLGVLYHGCDDVGDQRGLEALGGGGEEDIRDGILTLPAALAIRNPKVREQFLIDDDDEERLAMLAAACRAQLDEAEEVLDGIAAAARTEAEQFSKDPEPLFALIEQVRPPLTR